MQSLIIAFAMYSRIPMPRADWNDTNMRYAFCWFPVIGLVIGLVTGAVFYILTEWQVGSVFRGVCLTAVPVWITGEMCIRDRSISGRNMDLTYILWIPRMF